MILREFKPARQIVIQWLPACFDKIHEPWLVYYILPAEKAYAFIGSTIIAASITQIGEWMVRRSC